MRILFDEERKRPLKVVNRKGHFSMRDIGEWIKAISSINREFNGDAYQNTNEEIIYGYGNGDMVYRFELEERINNLPPELKARYSKPINKNYYKTFTLK